MSRYRLRFSLALMALAIFGGLSLVACRPQITPPADPPDFGSSSIASVPSDHSECSEYICGDTSSDPPPTNPMNGRIVFVNNGCSGCHYIDKEDKLVGPGLLNIAQRAATRVVGQTAEQYMAESIRLPSAFVVDGYPSPSPMPTFDSNLIGDAELRDVLAYLEGLG